MEKINCNVIQDILPLYIDDVVSDDTKELVEEHGYTMRQRQTLKMI